MTTNMERLRRIVDGLPETSRVDVEAWGGEPTFRVRGKTFVFTDEAARGITVKLPVAEAAAVIATDQAVQPAGYGLGRHGWIDVDLEGMISDDRWREVTEWVRTSYALVAPRRLARQVLAEDGSGAPGDGVA